MAKHRTYCYACGGNGKDVCRRCNGTGKVRGNVNRNKYYTCSQCNGTGKYGNCWKCNGSGMTYVEVSD